MQDRTETDGDRHPDSSGERNGLQATGHTDAEPEPGSPDATAARKSDRRAFLATVLGGLTTAVAGCISFPGRSTPTPTPSTTTTTTRERPTPTTSPPTPPTSTTSTATTPPTTASTTTTSETVTPDETPGSSGVLRTTAASGISIIDVTLRDGSIDLSLDSVPPGWIWFFILSRSLEVHEFVIARTDREPTRLPTRPDGSVNENQLQVFNAVTVPPGDRRAFPIDLPAGNYVLFCNVDRHYKLGEFAAFKVV